MSAKASGADTGSNGTAKSRDHNQGNQDRKYTVEQKAAVLRVRRCSPTAFYDILGLETVKTTVTESEIKKAYRKLSLLTHPDKNGHEHADEAFKMVSRAFGVLGDAEKKLKFDKFGGDPDSRFGGGAPPSNPFSGFGGAASRGGGGGGGGGAGGRGMYEEEISPEEMFRRFFGGGGMGGGFGGPFGGAGMFDAGPQFVFNMGGGPGVRVHQFGGARPRRRPRDPNAPEEPPASLRSTIMGLLPLLILFVVPLLSSLFSGSGTTAAGPSMRFDAAHPPHTMHRLTSRYKVDYWVNPSEVEHYSLSSLDSSAETRFIQQLRIGCEEEKDYRERLLNEAQGWFFQDPDKMHQARTMEMKSCKRLDDMGRMR
ncbi:hypothetical protein BP6252_12127 [Coleophoma cylindrospora]|uniref:J domain-containing protein n=1 Tax=Coleophoma cylindrospora TaxID=1849047 RepID=A0A3D8QH46_9HELO|nr:hypothetical protein BP6252_12127 [Coleophoma cylindrospora]